jgi:hypothetical protein
LVQENKIQTTELPCIDVQVVAKAAFWQIDLLGSYTKIQSHRMSKG